jgi:hypothetical protein
MLPLVFAALLMPWLPLQPASPGTVRPAGPRYVLEKGQGILHFEVPTNAGLVRGQVPLDHLEIKGPQGWSRFSFRVVMDPKKIRTGDDLRDRFIAEKVLKAARGNVVVFGTDRVAPRREAPEAELGSARIRAWMDPTRKGVFLEFPYSWEDDPDMKGGQLSFSHSAPLEKLGIPVPPHPFVKVVGPVKIHFEGHIPRA